MSSNHQRHLVKLESLLRESFGHVLTETEIVSSCQTALNVFPFLASDDNDNLFVSFGDLGSQNFRSRLNSALDSSSSSSSSDPLRQVPDRKQTTKQNLLPLRHFLLAASVQVSPSVSHLFSLNQGDESIMVYLSAGLENKQLPRQDDLIILHDFNFICSDDPSSSLFSALNFGKRFIESTGWTIIHTKRQKTTRSGFQEGSLILTDRLPFAITNQLCSWSSAQRRLLSSLQSKSTLHIIGTVSQVSPIFTTGHAPNKTQQLIITLDERITVLVDGSDTINNFSPWIRVGQTLLFTNGSSCVVSFFSSSEQGLLVIRVSNSTNSLIQPIDPQENIPSKLFFSFESSKPRANDRTPHVDQVNQQVLEVDFSDQVENYDPVLDCWILSSKSKSFTSSNLFLTGWRIRSSDLLKRWMARPKSGHTLLFRSVQPLLNDSRSLVVCFTFRLPFPFSVFTSVSSAF